MSLALATTIFTALGTDSVLGFVPRLAVHLHAYRRTAERFLTKPFAAFDETFARTLNGKRSRFTFIDARC